MFLVYAIYNSKHRKVYIGQTSNLHTRIAEHNDPSCKRHKYTVKFDGGWKLVYRETVNSRKEALIREKQLKSYRGREFVKKCIPL